MTAPEPTPLARNLHFIFGELAPYVGWQWQLEHKIYDSIEPHPAIPGQSKFFYLDLYEPSAQIAIELNGGHHYKEPQITADAAKQLCCERRGISLLWYPNSDIVDNNELLWCVEEFINLDGTVDLDKQRSFFHYEHIVLDALNLYFVRQQNADDPTERAQREFERWDTGRKAHKEVWDTAGDLGIDWDSVD